MGTPNHKKTNEIDKIIKKTVMETVTELKKARLIRDEATHSHFQKTEKLLYNYKGLLKAVEQKIKDIEYIQNHGIQNKSKSIVFYSSRGGDSAEEQYMDIIEGYKASKERTERLVKKIERALESVKGDIYYYIIESKYFDKLSNAEIEEKFSISESTIKRHRKRLINEIQTIIFGADALELSDNLTDF